MITAGLVALLLSVQVSAAVHGMESSSSHGDQDCELCQIFDRPAVFQVGPAATFERSASRALAQGGSHAQIIAVLQSVPGVRGVDLDALYRAGDPVALEPRLPAAVARPGQRGIPEPAELLLIDMAASSLEVLP